MIGVLSKPAAQVGIDDVEALISSEVPEGEQIEFKESLPARGQDPWMTGGDKIGDRARDAILEEAVAFANAHGGALVLGIEESSAKPPVAAGISPIPRCAELADRLKLVFRNCVEPQLPALEIFSVPTGDGAGVVVIRMGRSRLAPHRVWRTRVCPIRRSDRCEEMTMREIQDMTLNLSRGLDGLERRLAERKERFRQEFRLLRTPKGAWGIRMTAVPVGEEFRIDRVFRQGGIAKEFDEPWHKVRILENGNERRSGVGLRSPSPLYWEPRLRATRGETEYDFSSDSKSLNFFQEFHSDGLVEIGLVSIPKSGVGNDGLLRLSYPIEMLANLAAWADRIRKQVNAPAAEYALEVEILVRGNAIEVYDFPRYSSRDFPIFPPGQRVFPRYSLGDSSSIPDLLTLFYRDFWNSLGEDGDTAGITFMIQDWSG